MKKNLHPDYKKCIVTCACGYSFETRSTVDRLHVEICSQCHPFYTGKQKLVDTAGRVEQYIRKYEKGKKLRKSLAHSKADKEKVAAAVVLSSGEGKKAQDKGAGRRASE